MVRVAAGILLDATERVLITDRAHATAMNEFWEFPGGKLHPDETADAALRRELAEELGIDVMSTKHFLTVEHEYPDKTVAIEFFIVDEWLGIPSGNEGQALSWVDRSALGHSQLLPADVPVIEALEKL